MKIRKWRKTKNTFNCNDFYAMLWETITRERAKENP